MSDISYFYESDLNKSHLSRFCESLPNHLRRQFRDSFGEFKLIDRDASNVLQGYRGPYTNGGSGESEYLGPCNGLQEIRYWWGVSKGLMLVPLTGLVGFAIGRAFQDTNWHSLYFDSKTGECLSHNKNEAARKLNNKGCKLFQEGKYTEAVEYHNNAYQACSSGYKYEQKFKNNRDSAQAEEDAANFNLQGNRLFRKEKYTEALRKYREAYDKSQISKEYNKYKSNIENVQAERDAINLNSEGDRLFYKTKYFEALCMYQEAYCKSKIKNKYEKYLSNKLRAQVEIDAIKLNTIGDDLFNQNKYFDALDKYQEAYFKSKIEKESDKYWSNKLKAQVEIDAINKNSEGDNLLNQNRYAEALSKYQKAYDISKIKKESDKYLSNKLRAQVELDAINLNFAGDKLFCKGKYTEALIKYQAAYDKSKVEKVKIKYAMNKNSVQGLKNKLSILDTLWIDAWEAEDNVAVDRSGEARDLFERVLSETKDMLKIYPDNLKLKQYEILVSLKIDGNELFNEGLEAQQDGLNLLKKAEELQQDKKFELALVKYKEAKSKFSEAQENFKIGKQKDQRFTSCIEFVQDQLDEVLKLIKDIEQHTLISKLCNLDIRKREKNYLEADLSLSKGTEDSNYFKQI